MPSQLRVFAAVIALLTLVPASALEYVVRIDSALKSLEVRAQFEHPLAAGLNSARAARHVHELRRCDSGEPLTLRRGRMVSRETCIAYSLVLHKSAGSSRKRAHYSAVRDIVTSPDHWLMLPNDRDTRIDVVFVLPQGINVSVPWRPSAYTAIGKDRLRELSAVDNGEVHRLEAYSFRNRQISSEAVTAFGRFDKHIVAVPGGELRVALLRTSHNPEAQKMRRWLSDAARNVSQAHGRFPLESTQVVIVPVNERAKEPVPFGHVIRNGGEAVQFFVDTDRPLEAFLGDWTATHEFAHLLMPYVKDRWVSEGFASYYQNVLMARGGAYDQRTAWRKLYEGYGRGRGSAPGMSPRSATTRNGGLMKMYWSGAAIALMGDVRLRQLTGGRESLDTAMRRVRLCCLPSRRAYSDIEFFRLLDKKTGHTVFEDLHRDYANAAGFPDVRDLFNSLGIRTGSDVLLVDAELSGIRDAIMQPRPEGSVRGAGTDLAGSSELSGNN